MKILQKIDLTKGSDTKYTTFFYHKYSRFVYEVLTNGEDCAITIADKCGISKGLKHGGKLPKYILNKLN